MAKFWKMNLLNSTLALYSIYSNTTSWLFLSHYELPFSFFYGHDPWIITLCFIHIISSSFFLLAVRHGLTGTKKIWRATAIFDGVRARSIMPLTFGIQAKKNWLVLLFDPHARIMNMPLNIIIGKVKKEKTD